MENAKKAGSFSLRLPFSRQLLCRGDLDRGHHSRDKITPSGPIFFSVCCCQVVPHVSLNMVLWDSLPFGIHLPETELRGGEPLGGGFLVPQPRLHIVLGDSTPIIV